MTTHIAAVKKEKFAPGKAVKGRNEPGTIVQVMEVVAAVRGQDKHVLAEQIYSNTMRMFFPSHPI